MSNPGSRFLGVIRKSHVLFINYLIKQLKKLLLMLYRKLHKTLAVPAVLLSGTVQNASHEPMYLMAKIF